MELLRSNLHESLGDPSLEAVNFLNEVIDRYPNAISFAPGAPNPSFFDALDIQAYIDRYGAYLASEYKFTSAQIRRSIFQYGPSRGLINNLVANALQVDEGIKISPEALVITVGCQEAMLLVLRALCANSNDLLAVVDPSYMGIIGAARLNGMQIVPIEDDGTGIDLTQLEAASRAAITHGKRIKAVYVAPDFANPSGALMNMGSREALLALADEYDFLILEDSTYGFTASSDSKLPSLKELDQSNRVIYLGTFAKTCLPGARVGFVVADQSVRGLDGKLHLLADDIASLKTMVTINTSPICQAIIGGMLLENGGSLSSLAIARAATYQRNLRHLHLALDRHVYKFNNIKWNLPKGGFFVRMQLPVIVDNALLEISARDYGVLWTPMIHFFINRNHSKELRLSCSYLTTEQIDEGAYRLGAFLKSLK